jgi:hypothetical protein
MDDIAATNALAQAVAEVQGNAEPEPQIPAPADGTVELPGGLLLPGGELITEARVRELTGADEEALARAATTGSLAKYISTLLQCGVESVGEEKATPHILKSLLIGDREALVLGIRRATYGDVIDMDEYPCGVCGEPIDLQVTLDDIPIKKLESPTRKTYEIPLWKGGHAEVRLAVGADHEEVLSNSKLLQEEQNTLLLSKCVVRLPDSRGELQPVIGTGPVLRLGSKDRKTILRFLNETQPGPRYDEIDKVTHEGGCGGEFALAIGLSDLFRG